MKSIGAAIVNAGIAYVTSGFNPYAAAAAFAITVVMGAINKPTEKKAEDPQPVVQQPGMITTRQSVAPWQVIVGRSRVPGILTFRHISEDRKYWHMVITFACHECDALEEVWLNDEKVAFDETDGWGLGKWSRTRYDPVNYTQETAVLSDGTYAYFDIPGDPVVGVYRIVWGVPGDYQLTLNPVFVQADLLNTFDVDGGLAMQYPFGFFLSGNRVYLNPDWVGRVGVVVQYFVDNPDTDAFVRIRVSLGDEDANVQPFPELVSESGGAWSEDHRQFGHTKIYIRLESNSTLFPTGVPQVSAVFRGAKVYDQRDGVTRWENNAALVIQNYLTSTDYGLGADLATEIHAADALAAVGTAGEQIAIQGPGGDVSSTESRYTINGAFLTSEQPKVILERMLGACAGSAVNLGDQWHINMGAYYAPTVTLTQSHLAGPMTVTPMLPTREDGSANGVKGIFTDPANNWQPTDFPALQSATYLADDGGEVRWRDLDLSNFVTSRAQAQRLAKIDLMRLRQGLTVQAPFKVQAWQVVPGRTVALTDTQFGFASKAMELIDAKLDLVPAGGGVVIQTVLLMRETAPEIYDWAVTEEQVIDIAPNTVLPDATVVPAPGAPEITEALVSSRDSRGVMVQVTMAWLASEYPFTTSYQPEYKASADTTWTVLPLTAGLQAVIPDFPSSGDYDFRVRTVTEVGGQSDYATASKNISGLAARPSTPTNFTVRVISGMAYFAVDASPDLDVIEGGKLMLRHSPQTVGATWNQGVLMDRASWPGNVKNGKLPLLAAGTYMAKWKDGSGQLSSSYASFVLAEAHLVGFTGLASITESPSFAGAKTNVVATSEGYLQIENTTLWDDLGLIDSVTDYIDSVGGIKSTGQYVFTNSIDLGSVLTVRLFPTLDSLAFDTADLWDSRTTLIDLWGGEVDGDVVEDAECWLEVRATNDDPAGAPTWGSWHPLPGQADYAARAFQFRLNFACDTVTHNRRVGTLTVAAKQPT